MKEKNMIHGDFNTVYDKIMQEYTLGNVELISYFETIKTPDLTMQETFNLYIKLRYKIDDDIILRITENEVVDETNNHVFSLNYWIQSVGDLYGE